MRQRHIFPFVLLVLAACTDTATDAPATRPPPPISGGTLLITAQHVVAADPDTDRVWIVDAAKKRVSQEVVLRQGDEPGRLVQDADGRVHVGLRRSGEIATIDVRTGKLLGRQPVCAAPRGVAYEEALDAIHVACLSGQLVTLRASDRSELRRLRLERDLRDVVVEDDGLLVSRFRTAEVLRLDAQGHVLKRTELPRFQSEPGETFNPAVAWRMQSLPGGGSVVVHQRALIDSVPLPRPGSTGESTYGSSGGPRSDPGIVHSAVSVIPRYTVPSDLPDPPEAGGPLVPLATLPVDIATSTDGSLLALAAAGSGVVITMDASQLGEPIVAPNRRPANGQPIAVAFDEADRIWVQTRRPAGVHILGEPLIAFGDSPTVETGADAAHDLFHLTTGRLGSMSCASCHPEGADDGHVWSFVPFRGDSVQRRTQTLRGGLTAGPYHWDGALPDFNALVADVMVGRMGGEDPGAGRTEELAQWLIAMPPLPVDWERNTDAVDRGRALYHSDEVGCATCHVGDKLTNDETVDVGTGERLQVPTLVGIAHHAPFMHDGCAPTLRDRFGPCGGGDKHGNPSHLSAAEIDDLIAYLETL